MAKITKDNLTIIWKSAKEFDRAYTKLSQSGHPDADWFRNIRDRETEEYVRRGGKRRIEWYEKRD